MLTMKTSYHITRALFGCVGILMRLLAKLMTYHCTCDNDCTYYKLIYSSKLLTVLQTASVFTSRDLNGMYPVSCR